MATTVMNPAWNDVQWLADRPRGEGMVVSCYADTSVSEGVRPLWREHLRNEVKRLEEALAGDHAARITFQRNIEVIYTTLSSPPVAQARGVAVFAAVQRDLVTSFAVATPLPNRLVVDEEPYLVPLLELLHRQRRYLVVHTDTHRGRLYTAAYGAVHLIESIDENVPKRHRAAGELWGKQQATIARHREDHALHYRTELTREIQRAWSDERYDGMVLLGTHEILEKVRGALPEYLARRIIHEAPYAWVGRQPRLETKMQAIQDAAMAEHDRRVFEDLRRRLLERHHVVTGPQPVIDAMRNSQVGYPGCLVMAPDAGAAASHCTGCGSIFADGPARCSLCESGCERRNLWQEIALLAVRHRVPVHFVAAGSGLEEHGGVAALLARGEPWRVTAEAQRTA